MRNAVIGTLALSVFALSGCGGGSSTPPAPAKVYSIGEAIATEKYELKITKVETRQKVGVQYADETASEGATIVGVQYSIKNIGTKPMNSFEQPSLKLFDDKGTEYSSDISKSSAYSMEVDPNQKIMSDLNPGITVKAATAFEVSKELFKKDTWTLKSSDGASISLAAPASAVPAEKK